jgi:hypothetical protein
MNIACNDESHGSEIINLRENVEKFIFAFFKSKKSGEKTQVMLTGLQAVRK